jgi:hypothetical protein
MAKNNEPANTEANCAAAAEGAALMNKTTVPKAPAEVKVQPTTPEWSKYKMAQVMPAVFSWRDKRYVTAELTALEIEALAADKDFRAIVAN